MNKAKAIEVIEIDAKIEELVLLLDILPDYALKHIFERIEILKNKKYTL